MDLASGPGQLVVASDVRNTLFRRALVLLDEVHYGLEEFSLGPVSLGDGAPEAGAANSLAVVPASQVLDLGPAYTGALVSRLEGDPVERALATFVQGRTNTARRAVDAVAHLHSEIEGILSSFEREFPPIPTTGSSRDRVHEVSFSGVKGPASEEVLRMAAATTAAAARFRVRAAEAAKAALQVYDTASKQAAIAAQATTKALELQVMAEQHSMTGKLPQALDAIRQANRFRDESADAAQSSCKLQHEYLRHRKEAQEAHAQADAAMRHAYSLERDALRSSVEAATRDHAMWKERYDNLSRQAEDLRAQVASCEAEADAAGARAEQAQQHADMHMAAGNYELGNALVGEAVRSKEQAGYARAQAAAAREALQRLIPDMQTAREHMEEAEKHVQELSERQAQLQDATAKQRKDRLEDEVAELAALCSAAESASAMHAELVRVYEERLEQDRQQYHTLTSEGKTAEADALAVHISTWQELLEVARQNHDSSKAEAEAMRARLDELSKVDVNDEGGGAAEDDAPEEFRQLREARGKEERAAQAAAILVRELTMAPVPDPALEASGMGNDGLLLQTELHHQRIAKLAEQMHREREDLEGAKWAAAAGGQPNQAQADSLLDSMAVSHLVGTLETTRLLQLWKQRSDQAEASAKEMRETWLALEQEATAKADEAVRLEEQALALEHAGCTEEAASTMAQAEDLHRLAEQLRIQADKAKAVLIAREKAAGDAQTQSRFLVQGLHDVEHAAERLQAELGLRGYVLEAQQGAMAPVVTGEPGLVPSYDASQVPVDALAPQNGSTAAQDEMATVMFASPSLLSRSSSVNAVYVSMDTVGTARPQVDEFSGHATASSRQALLGPMHDPGDASTMHSAPGSGGAPGHQGLSQQATTDAWIHEAAGLGPQSLDFQSSVPQPLASSALLPGQVAGGRDDEDLRLRGARLARLVQELESHAGAEMSSAPVTRWEDPSGMLLALRPPEVDEHALAAVSNRCMSLRDQVRDYAAIAEVQLQEENARQLRWQGLIVELTDNLDASTSDIAERVAHRCATVTAACTLAEEALTAQTNCHDALVSHVSTYRLAVSTQQAMQQAAATAQAEVESAREQLQSARKYEENLVGQVQQLEGQIAVFEAEGKTAQALTARYELRRLQNKHEEAEAQANQLQVVYEASQQKAAEALAKEAEANEAVRALGNTWTTLVEAANEAGTAVQHAMDGYGHAASAMALGSQLDLAQIHTGAEVVTGDESASAAEVQRCLEFFADRQLQARQCLQASRRLQDAVLALQSAPSGNGLKQAPADYDHPQQIVSQRSYTSLASASSEAGPAWFDTGPASVRSGLSDRLSPTETPSITLLPAPSSGLQAPNNLFGHVPSASQLGDSVSTQPRPDAAQLEGSASERNILGLLTLTSLAASEPRSGLLPSRSAERQAAGALTAEGTAGRPIHESPIVMPSRYSLVGQQPVAQLQPLQGPPPRDKAGPRLHVARPMFPSSSLPVPASQSTLPAPLAALVPSMSEGHAGRVQLEQPPRSTQSPTQSVKPVFNLPFSRSKESNSNGTQDTGALGRTITSGVPQGDLGELRRRLYEQQSAVADHMGRTSTTQAQSPASFGSDSVQLEAFSSVQSGALPGLPGASWTQQGRTVSSGLAAFPGLSSTQGTLSTAPSSGVAALAVAPSGQDTVPSTTGHSSTPSGSPWRLGTWASPSRPSGLSAATDSMPQVSTAAPVASGLPQEQSSVRLGDSNPHPSYEPSRLGGTASQLESRLSAQPSGRSMVLPTVGSTLQSLLTGVGTGRVADSSEPGGQPSASRVPRLSGGSAMPDDRYQPTPSDYLHGVASTGYSVHEASTSSVLPSPTPSQQGLLGPAAASGLPSASAQQGAFALPFNSAQAAQRALGQVLPMTPEQGRAAGGRGSLASSASQVTGAKQPPIEAFPSTQHDSPRFSAFPSDTQPATMASNSFKDPRDVTPALLSGRPSTGALPFRLSTGAEPFLSALPSQQAQAMLAIQTELDVVYARYQEELDRKRAPVTAGAVDAVEEERLATQLELEQQLRQAAQELQAVRVQQSLLRDASPAEVQAFQDRLQCHEKRVAVLKEALRACDELAASKSSMDRTRGAVDVVDLEAKQYDDTLSLLDRAAELCGAATRELQLQTLDVRDQVDPAVQQRLTALQDKAADFARRRLQIQREAELAQGRRKQLEEQLATDQSAVRLREDWLGQTRKAADAAKSAVSWEDRVQMARLELQKLAAPFQQLEGKAAAASSSAQALTVAAAQQRKEAAALVRQATEQREEARRMAASGRLLEADAANANANRLQGQADGLFAQANRLDEDAQAMEAEASKLRDAAGHARDRVMAQEQVLEQVSAAHQLSLSVLKWNRTAAAKLSDASQKQDAAARHQAELSDMEVALASMEAQVSSSGGATLRPDELAAQMINVVRGKQQAAQMRTRLRAAQEQLEQDRDAAAVAIYQASKVEDQCAQLAPKIAELEEQAQAQASTQQMAGSSTSLSAPTPRAAQDTDGIGLTGTSTAATPEPHENPPSAIHALQLASQGQPAGRLPSTGDQSAVLPFGLSVVLPNSTAGQSTPAIPPGASHRASQPELVQRDRQTSGLRRDDPSSTWVVTGDMSDSSIGRRPSSTTITKIVSVSAALKDPGHRPEGLARAPSAHDRGAVRPTSLAGSGPGSGRCSSQTKEADPSLKAGRTSGADRSLGTFDTRASDGPSVATASLATPHAADIDGSAGGASRQSLLPSPRRPFLHLGSAALQSQATREAWTSSHGRSPQSPAGNAEATKTYFPPVQMSQLSRSTFLQGTPRAGRVAEQAGGTAGALLDTVGGRTLRPLSTTLAPRAHAVKTSHALLPGDSVSNQQDGSIDKVTDSGSQRVQQQDDSVHAALEDLADPDDGANDKADGAEPDSKMYRVIKHRLGELDGRIKKLRQQADNAGTAARMLCRKHEQLRADYAQAGGSAQQAALLDHCAAVIDVKEAEASLGHKQADWLVEEAAACNDALQYAVHDWHLRRQLDRLGILRTVLGKQTQDKAMESQALDAEIADASECIMLAQERDGRRHWSYVETPDQHSLDRFLKDQDSRLKLGQQRAAESRAEAARLAASSKQALERKQTTEEKVAYNKALYQSAVEVADCFDQAATIAEQEQYHQLIALKAKADALRLQLIQESSPTAASETVPAPLLPATLHFAPAGSSSHGDSMKPLHELARLGHAVADAMAIYQDEIAGASSEALLVFRQRIDRIQVLLQLYDKTPELGSQVPGPGDNASGRNPAALRHVDGPSDKRSIEIAAVQSAIKDLDHTCSFAADLRTICKEATQVQAALLNARVGLGLRVSHDAALSETESSSEKEAGALARRLANLDMEISLARDQLSCSLQLVDYRQAAAQLADAQRDLEQAAGVASDAAAGLQSRLELHRESLLALKRHLETVAEEARGFKAGGNVLQAAASGEAARRLGKELLDAEASLEVLLQEAQLKESEEQLARMGAAELQKVAEGSAELTALLMRIINLQQEARAVSRQLHGYDYNAERYEQEAKSQMALSETSNKQYETLQHESLQCRTNLRFADADSLLEEARRCRLQAQEHSRAAAAAHEAAVSTSLEQAGLKKRQEQLLKEIQLLHTAAGHLQGGLSCMRDKHHLVRRMRDVEHRLKSGPESVQGNRLSAVDRISERNILQTQLSASDVAIEHHLTSKASYVLAADNLHLSTDSMVRGSKCAVQAEAAMQDVMQARMLIASGATGAVPLLTSSFTSDTSSAVSTLTSDGRTHLTISIGNPAQVALQNGAWKLSISAPTGDLHDNPTSQQMQHAELRYRCLEGGKGLLHLIAEAAERASQARHDQVRLSDQAANLVSDLAAKILEAEANSDEAAAIQASKQPMGSTEEEAEENFKTKLTVNALLQKAEANRIEAATLQSRVEELQQLERSASGRAAAAEAALTRLQDEHRHTMEALNLMESISLYSEQEASLQGQMQALLSEVTQLDREIRSMDNKVAQLRQQLKTTSHSASSADVANLMVVMQQMLGKAAANRALHEQHVGELDRMRTECAQLTGEIRVMLERADHVLRASQTHEQVRQALARQAQLQSDLSAAQASSAACSQMLGELQQHSLQLAAFVPPDGQEHQSQGDGASTSSVSTARQSQQYAAIQAAIALAEHMLQTHDQHVAILQSAASAWEVTQERYAALLSHQEQVMQQSEWRARLQQFQDELQRAAAQHAGKAQKLRNSVGVGQRESSRQMVALTYGIASQQRLEGKGSDLVKSVLSQAATIRTASEAAHQQVLGDAEDSLASRASLLAAGVGQQLDRFTAASDFTELVLDQLSKAAAVAISFARLQQTCVDVCSDQGKELATMQEAMTSVRGYASKIQTLMEAADRHARAGQNREAAAARGQATAIQEALQQDLQLVRSCRQRLAALDGRMDDAKQELQLVNARMSQVLRPALIAQNIAEYVHRACELNFTCGSGQRATLRTLRLAAEALSRADLNRKEEKASRLAADQLMKVAKVNAAEQVRQAAAALERAATEAEAQRRLLDAQVVQEADACASDNMSAGLYDELASLSVKLLQAVDAQGAHQDEHEQLDKALEALQRSLEGAGELLDLRRAELEGLAGQVEAQKFEAQLLTKMGNHAQARVRQDAANLLTAQLAEITGDVLKLEARYKALEEQLATMRSMHLKSEAYLGLLGQLTKLHGAAVGHLLDVRDAHDSQASFVRDAALEAVELAKAEAKLREAENRLSSLRRPSSQPDVSDVEGTASVPVDKQSLSDILRATSLAQAELLVAEKQRAQAEQEVLALRSRLEKAELAVQSNQLRLTKARQRTEDAQNLADGFLAILSSLQGSETALEARASPGYTTGSDATYEAPGATSLSGDAALSVHSDGRHHDGVLAAAQLESVVMQALAEAAAKMIDALEVAAMSEAARVSVLTAERKAKEIREAVSRQQAEVAALRTAADTATLSGHVQRLRSLRFRAASFSVGPQVAVYHHGAEGERAKGYGLPLADAGQEARAAALRVEGLQHEGAYLEATIAQEKKLVAGQEYTHALLRRASATLMDIARFGSDSAWRASRQMTADDAASLLAACRHLSRQHATSLMLAPALESCKEAESFLRASLKCVEDAWQMRKKALGGFGKLDGGTNNSPDELPVVATSGRYTGSGADGGAAEASAALDSESQSGPGEGSLLTQSFAEEEQLLEQVQQLDAAAEQLLAESKAQLEAFEAEWATTAQLPDRGSQREGNTAGSDASAASTASLSSQEASKSQEPSYSPQARRHVGLLSQPAIPVQPPTLAPTQQHPLDHSMSLLLSAVALRTPTPSVDEGITATAIAVRQAMEELVQKNQLDHTPTSSSSEPPTAAPGPLDDDDNMSPRASPSKPNGAAHLAETAGAVKSSVRSPWPEGSLHAAAGGDVDADLVVMAAETVRRAKAQAVALAMQSSSFLAHVGPVFGSDAYEGSAVAAQDRSKRASTPREDGRQGNGDLFGDESARTAASHMSMPSRQDFRPSSEASVGEALQPPLGVTMESRLGQGVGPRLRAVRRVSHSGWSLPRSRDLSVSTLSDSLEPPSSGATEMGLAAFAPPAPALPDPAPLTTGRWQEGSGSRGVGDSASARSGAATPQSPKRLGPDSVKLVQPSSPSPLSTQQQEQQGTLALPRLPLPDDLGAAEAGALQELWSNAALHYERLQHLHEGALEYCEGQYQRSQAQLQMLQTEGLKARSVGRLAEAKAVDLAAAKWQQRASQLDAAIRRHSMQRVRYKAMAHRAVTMVERLQLLAYPNSSSSIEVKRRLDDARDLMSRLVPRLPGSTLAGCGVMQALQRLHGELVQQVAALHAAMAGLQQQSQRLFAKAARRSNKLKIGSGPMNNSAHAACISKAKLCAEQSAALGERAAELAGHARTLQELADGLSTESTSCSQMLDRLQSASDHELAAQQAIVQTADWLLCEAMEAVGHADGYSTAASSTSEERDMATKAESGPEARSRSGNLDSLLQARYKAGTCLVASRIDAARSEELARQAARAAQGCKAQLEERLGTFARRMEQSAGALRSLALQRLKQQESLVKQMEAAALCVARARSKANAQRAIGDTGALDKYLRAGEGWQKQLEKLRQEASAASAAAEELNRMSQTLAALGSSLSPVQAALDEYLDRHLEAWASAALSNL